MSKICERDPLNQFIAYMKNKQRWTLHFLTCRKQRVVVRGTFSDWAPVISGTPQGTILGPILFLSYINDIVDSVSSKIKLFADDTKIYRELRNPSLDEQYTFKLI